jgi:hypothetical protein
MGDESHLYFSVAPKSRRSVPKLTRTKEYTTNEQNDTTYVWEERSSDPSDQIHCSRPNFLILQEQGLCSSSSQHTLICINMAISLPGRDLETHAEKSN